MPNLIYNSVAINDTGGNGNGNGYPDPGETGVQIFVSLTNNGAATSTGISAVLSTTTPGVTVTQNTSAYPNIAAAGSAPNTTAYVISLSPSLVCGTVMQFNLAVTTAQGSYNFPFSIRASIPQPPASAFFDNFENGINGWTTGGTGNAWAQTTAQSHSPTHSWTDSPAGNYANDVELLAAVAGDQPGWQDRGGCLRFLQVRPRGGLRLRRIWSTRPMAARPTTPRRWPPSTAWRPTGCRHSVSAAALDNQANARLRLRFSTDVGVVLDGIYVDDFNVSYQPIVCATAESRRQWNSAT